MFRSKARLARDIAEAYPKASAIASRIVEVANNVGTHPYWLANLINFESAGTFSSSVQNPSTRATGLIQFMPSTARGMGTTVEQLAQMTPLEQMNWVEAYLSKYKSKGLNNPTDIYMAVFYPVSIGNPQYKFPDYVARANNGIDTPIAYAIKANRNAKLPTGLEATVPYDENEITLNNKKSIALVPKWVWYVSAPILAVSGYLYIKSVRKRISSRRRSK